MSEHLDFNTDFLDKDTPLKTGATSHAKPLSEKIKYNWKKILIIGGVILFIGWVIFSDSGSSSPASTSNSSYTSPSTSENTVRNGQYSCSRYDSDQADSLDPTESEQQMTLAQNLLQQRANELDRLKSEIDNSYVNDSSPQYEIDDYNEKVDTYNSKLTSYKRDASSMSVRIDQYNTQVERRNNYLIAHCTKSY
jgi:peptidoglycan hydrolase CwlO-like protein